ncbi:MAG: DUF3037 domain-containing protein [Proteobacteria bacterium]|nr:DUF3037 domain-containing protein [Pseudomonadota bacterium]
MRYMYSVIRFVPDPVRGEFVNVGLLAGSDESSEWEIRAIENLKRARTLDERGLLPHVLHFVDDIGRKVDRFAETIQESLFAAPDERLSEEWLTQLSEEARNVVQFSVPSIIIADNIDEAVNTLFEQFIVDPEARRFPFKKKNVALAATRHAYRDAGLNLSEHLVERVSVKGQHHKERFDFVVANGSAVQLAQTWSFQMPNQDDLAEQIKAWAWTVSDIRRSGGAAETDARHIDVPCDVDIEVVYVPPATGGPREVLTEALAAFSGIDVQPVEFDRASTVGQKASRLIAA